MDNKDDHENIYLGAIAAVLFVIVVLGANYYLVPKFFGADKGLFGDMFGGANALFSGLAFVGVIVAICLQSKELELQRKELAATREVLKDQKSQLELQNHTIKKQQFENTFFELLKLYKDNLDGIKVLPYEGRAAIKHLYNIVESKITPISSDVFIATLAGQYEQLDEFLRIKLHTYFRIVYNIIKFIARSGFSEDEKDFYVGLLRAQLSAEELNYLALNCISSHGSEKMLPLMKKYNMFKHTPESKLITSEVLEFLEKRRD